MKEVSLIVRIQDIRKKRFNSHFCKSSGRESGGTRTDEPDFGNGVGHGRPQQDLMDRRNRLRYQDDKEQHERKEMGKEEERRQN